MAWYLWVAVALAVWGLMSVVVGAAVGRMLAFGLADGMEALDAPVAPRGETESAAPSSPAVAA